MIEKSKSGISIEDFFSKETLKRMYDIGFDDFTKWIHDSICDLLFMYMKFHLNLAGWSSALHIGGNTYFRKDDEGFHFDFTDEKWLRNIPFFRKTLDAVESMMKIRIKGVGHIYQMIEEVRYTGFYVEPNDLINPYLDSFAFFHRPISGSSHLKCLDFCSNHAPFPIYIETNYYYSYSCAALWGYFKEQRPCISFTIKEEVLSRILYHKIHLYNYRLHGLPTEYGLLDKSDSTQDRLND